MSYTPTPVKQLLGDYIADGTDKNILHCRVPNRVANRAGGPDSVFTWIEMLGDDQFVWRPVDSPHVTLGHCLDIRRDGDEGGQFFTHADMAEMMNSIQGPQPGAKDRIEWPQLDGQQQQHQTQFAFPMEPPPFSLPPPSGANSPDSLFDEPDNARDFSPPTSPKALPQAGSRAITNALPPPLMLPGGDGTVAPRDIFSPLNLPHLPLPSSPPAQTQSQPQTAPGSFFPPPPPEPRTRRTRTSSASKTNGWDDSDYDMSDGDASGDDDSDFAGPSTSAGKGRVRKTGGGSAGSSPRGSETKTPLPCSFPGCGFVQRNGRQVDLTRHELTHWPTRPKHTCPDCNHTVSRKDALRRHREQSCKKTGTRVQRTPRRKARRSFN